jgi:coenzyme F420 hydrogenase subunit beta
LPSYQNISKVVSQKLCNSCGACFSVCPTGAIQYHETVGGYYFPAIDKEVCIDCGLCLSVCAGIYFSEELLNSMPEDPFAGQVLNAFVGKATDKKIYSNSQSGGIVSALLVHALEVGRIKGAVSISMEPGSPCRPVVQLARDRQEIFKSQKSKYCPVPLLQFIRDLNEEDGPVAIVGLSCHMHGLHNILNVKPKMKSKLAFTVGLVCDRVLTYAALDYLIKESKIGGSTPSLLHFRDKSVAGYPGDVRVVGENGHSSVLPASNRIQIKDFFTPARCRICFDKMNVFSDITVGDPHGIEGFDRKSGESIVVTRTECGAEVVNETQRDVAINIREIAYEQVLTGQGINQKREHWRGYIEAWRKFERGVPNYYGALKTHTAEPVKIAGKYIRDLRYAIKMDEFPDRTVLIDQVKKQLKRKHLVKRVFSPARFAKRLVNKIL